jgi:predicted RNase H-like HicB family nuclease
MSNEISYKIEYELDKETGQVVATIPELNHVSSFGDSFAEAEANVREAALGYLEVLVKEQKEIPRPAFKTDGTYLKLFFPKVA